MATITSLSDECMIAVFVFLRAVDLSMLLESNRSTFSMDRISRAVVFQLLNIYPQNLFSQSPVKFAGDVYSDCRPCHLFSREVKAIIAALSTPPPISKKGFWVSSSWIANAKKYFEGLELPEIISKKGTQRQKKIRQRRGSDALPPWPSMNADLVCSHGSLSLAKVPKAKRRLVESKVWYFLRKFYSSGPEFKSSRSQECPICFAGNVEAKEIAAEKRSTEKSMRKIILVPESLEGLVARKSGVPSDVSTFRSLSGGDSCLSLEDLVAFSTVDLLDGLGLRQPLMPGLYNIVPKVWLKKWRQYIRDPTVESIMPLDCTSLLCYSHGHFVVPPHLEEFLIGARKSLLGGLGQYPGEIVEILSVAEWEELQSSLGCWGNTDFNVRCCLDGEVVSWNVEVCRLCDPFNFTPHLKEKKSPLNLCLKKSEIFT